MREWLQFDPHSALGHGCVRGQGSQGRRVPPGLEGRQRAVQGARHPQRQYQLLGEANAARHATPEHRLPSGRGRAWSRRRHGGLRFKIKVFNGTDGHGVPTGFDAERNVFLQTTVTDSQGKVVFKSGDLDPNGDLRRRSFGLRSRRRAAARQT